MERPETSPLLAECEQNSVVDVTEENISPSSISIRPPNIDDLENAHWRKLFYGCVLSAEVIGVVTIILTVYEANHYRGGFSWDGSEKEFNYHPVFMVTGMVFLSGNAAMKYRILRNLGKFQVKLIHGLLNTGVLVFAILGVKTVFDYDKTFHVPNVYSLHSWMGMAIVVLFGCQLLVGTLAFLFPKFSAINRGRYLHIHVVFGIVLFVLTIACCLTGLTEKAMLTIKDKYQDSPPEGVLVNSFGILLVLFAALVLVILLTPFFKRLPDAKNSKEMKQKIRN